MDTFAVNLADNLKTFQLTFEGDNTRNPVLIDLFAKTLGSFKRIETMRITISLAANVGELFH